MYDSTFNAGDVLKVYRGLYYHYGVYVGDNKVVHFSSPMGFEETDPQMADIFEVSLDDFAQNGIPIVDESCSAYFTSKIIVERARKMIGTQLGEYSLFGNNCEHFANWCKTGEMFSSQLEFAKTQLKGYSSIFGYSLTVIEKSRSERAKKLYDFIWFGEDCQDKVSNVRIISIRKKNLELTTFLELAKEYKVANSRSVAAMKKKLGQFTIIYLAYCNDKKELISQDENNYIVIEADGISSDIESLFGNEDLIVLN